MRILAFPAFSNEATNPYQSLLYTPMGKERIYEFTHKRAFFDRFDVIHLHWPDLYIRSPNLFQKLKKLFLLTAIVVWNKLRGVKIIWTVHNLAVQDTGFPRLTNLYMRWFVKQCDGLIFLTHVSRKIFEKKFSISPKTKITMIPHGHYRTVYPRFDKSEARDALDLPHDKKVLLFFGLIRPYKNVEKLVKDFIDLDEKETHLVVAGSAYPDMEKRLRKLAKGHDNVHFFIEFVSNERVGLFFAASDMVVLPFQAILNSGSIVLALSFNRHVIAPSLGSIEELRDMVGGDWITLYDGEFNKEILRSGISSISKSTTQEKICPLNQFDWGRISKDTYNFYQGL